MQLLSAAEQRALAGYLAQVYAEQPAGLEIDPAADDRSAEAELQPLGPRVVDYVFRPWFEGPFFTPLRDISAAMLRSWLKVYPGATFYQVAGGMDTPWLRIAEQLPLRLNTPVETLRLSAGGVELELPSGARRYDGAVLACPATVSARILGEHVAEVLPWLGEVRYSPEVRVYAARHSGEDTALGIHLVPPTPVFSVEQYSGTRGAWGACPPDWQWALVCASGPDSAELIRLPAGEARRILWDRARSVAPRLFRARSGRRGPRYSLGKRHPGAQRRPLPAAAVVPPHGRRWCWPETGPYMPVLKAPCAPASRPRRRSARHRANGN